MNKNKKKIAVILFSSIKFDSRVRNTVEVLGKTAAVDLYYLDAHEDDGDIFFNPEISLYPLKRQNNTWRKFLRNTFFLHEYTYISDYIVRSGKTYDFVYANDLPSLLPALKVKKKLKKTKIIYDAHEIYLETLNQLFPIDVKGFKKYEYALMKKIMKASGKIMEKKLYKKADYRITVNQSLAGYLQKSCRADFLVMRNCPPLKEVPEQEINFRKKFNWTQEDRIFLYQGRLNKGRGLEHLVKAINKADERIKLLILGRGALQDFIKRFIEKNNLENRIKLIDFVQYERLAAFTVAADFGICFLSHYNLNTTYGLPNKFFEYIHAELPQLCSNHIEFNRILETHKVGVTTDIDVPSIRKNMEKLAFKEDISLMIADCRDARQIYTWENESRILREIIRT